MNMGMIMDDRQEDLVKRLRDKAQGKPLKLSPPTTNAAKQIEAFFSKDRDVFTIFNYNQSVMCIFVKGAAKAEAINFLIKHEIKLGDLALKIEVTSVLENGEQEELPVPTYTITTEGILDYLRTMFRGSDMKAEFSHVYDPIMDKNYYFLELEDCVLKAKNDNLSNPYGFECFMPADLFKEYFSVGTGIFVSTFARN